MHIKYSVFSSVLSPYVKNVQSLKGEKKEKKRKKENLLAQTKSKK
jgi:hypothetical protein